MGYGTVQNGTGTTVQGFEVFIGFAWDTQNS